MVEGSVLRRRVAQDATEPAAGLRFFPRLLRAALRWLLGRLFVFELDGMEHIPSGRYIVSANHPGWLETLTLAAFLPASGGLRFLASRAVTVEVGWRRPILTLADAVLPLDVDGHDSRPAIRGAIGYLKSGASIGIFPEDLTLPTPPDGTVRPLRRGVAFLARASQSPVVPVGVPDTRELWRGRRIRVRIGAPLDPPRDKSEDDAFLARLGERIEALRPRPEPLPAHRPWPWLSKLL